MFRLYVKRVIKSPIFIICTCVAIILWISGCGDYILWAKDEIIDMLYLFVASYTFGVVAVMAPALMTVPFLFFFAEELQKKLVYYQMIRTSFRHYYRDQIFGALFASFISAAISVLLFSVICLAAGAGFEIGKFNTFFDGTCMENIFYSSRMWLLYVWYCVTFLLYCMPWTLFGLLLSLFTKNRYVLIAAPFVCFWALSYVIEMLYPYCHAACWLWPALTLLHNSGWIYEEFWTMAHTILYPLIYNFGLIAILASVYYFVSVRRFRREGI